MFRPNTKHKQPAIICAASELPEKQRKRLKSSWANTFYQEFFSRIDEGKFSVLYSEVPSRPNVPVNVLVGLEALKAGFGWSDQELYDNFCYDLQVRYALGYDRLGDGDFEIRTLYYFRERLSRYNLEQGENLLEKAFEQITEAQISALKVRTGMQRMDSTQIASNIVSASRIQLLVEGIQRVERILSEADRRKWSKLFVPYIKDRAGHFTYRIKGEKALQGHLTQIGQTIYDLLLQLEHAYAEEKAYQVLARLFSEHFKVIAQELQLKENSELTSSSLQSVDDLEASYRTKGGKSFQGYVANLTETCDPENQVQLITKVQVAPNNVDDTQLLAEALPELKERTDLATLYTDGGYGSPEMDDMLREKAVLQIQTAIRGRKPSIEKLHLSDFEIKKKENGKPTRITCPNGQSVKVQASNKRKSFVAHFELGDCQTCPFAAACPAKPGKRDPRYSLRFTQAQANVAQRRKRNQIHLEEGQNLRAAVEATVRQVKHPFPASKLPVRGQFRVTCMLIGSAIMSNIRRIQRYEAFKTKLKDQKNTELELENGQPSSFCALLIGSIQSTMTIFIRRIFVFGC